VQQNISVKIMISKIYTALQNRLKTEVFKLHTDRYKGEFEGDQWVAVFPVCFFRLTGISIVDYLADGKIGLVRFALTLIIADKNTEQAVTLDLLERILDILDGLQTKEDNVEIEVNISGAEWAGYNNGVEIYNLNIQVTGRVIS